MTGEVDTYVLYAFVIKKINIVSCAYVRVFVHFSFFVCQLKKRKKRIGTEHNLMFY